MSLDSREPYGKDGAGQSPLGRVLAAAPHAPAWGVPTSLSPQPPGREGTKTLCWVIMLSQHLGLIIHGREVNYNTTDLIRCCSRGVLCCLELSWTTTLVFQELGVPRSRPSC